MSSELFPGIMPDEKVYIVVREHWFHFLIKVLVWGLLVVFGIVFAYFGPEYVPFFFTGTALLVMKLIGSIYLIFLAVYIFLVFVIHYLNVHIITNMRVVDIDQKGLFSHTFSELHINKLEDATSQVNGFFGTIFNFGNVLIQTAGASEQFDFEHVPEPSKLVKIILDLYEAQRQGNEE